MKRAAGMLSLAVLFAFYSAGFPGIRGTNEGASYALVRSMTEGRVEIDSYREYARNVDISMRGEHWYSDKAPGTAAVAVPFYLAGRALAGSDADARGPSPPLHSYRSPSNLAVPPVEEYVTALVAALAGVITVLLTFLLARELGGGVAAAVLAAAAVALGTMMWRYSTQLFVHAPSAAATVGAVLLAVRAVRSDRRGWLLPGLGALLGAAVAFDYSLVVSAAGLTVAVLVLRRRGWTELLRDGISIGAGAAVPLLLLLAYHAVAFGSPFTNAYAFKVNNPWMRTIGGAYSGPMANLIPMIGSPVRGLLPWNPILLLAPVGLVSLWRGDRPASIVVLVATLPLFVLQAKLPQWFGGGTQDSRYVTALIPPLVAPLAVALSRARKGSARAAFWVSALVLTSAGFALQATRLVLSLGHEVRLIGGPPLIVAGSVDLDQAVRTGLAAMLPSVRYLPATLGAALVVAAAAWLARERRRSITGGRARRGSLDVTSVVSLPRG